MSFAACTPVSSGSGFLSSAISYLDCAGRTIGSVGYTALTQPGSTISQLALVAITLFIAFHGVKMMFGRMPDMGDALLAVAKIGLVLMLVTSWPAVRTLFAQPSFSGPAELAAETRIQGPLPLVERLGRDAALRTDAKPRLGSVRRQLVSAQWRPIMSKSRTKTTKSASVIKLLSRERGATIAEIVKATGWKEHSVRAFLTGVRKSATLIKEQRSDGETAYRICLSKPTPDSHGEEAAS